MKTHEVDYLVVGGGPAGVQASYYLQNYGLNYCCLESGSKSGTFFNKFPRHRKLISINKIHTGYQDDEINLRWDWNSLLEDFSTEPLRFREYSKNYFPSADDFLTYISDFVDKNKLNIHFDTYVTNVHRHSENGYFTIETKNNVTYHTKYLIVATGLKLPWLPNIPGIDQVEDYTSMSIDPNDFQGQRVLILGKGNSAFETAENLIETTNLIHVCSPNPLKMAWSSHFVGHLRAINNSFLDTYQLKSQNALLDADIVEIIRENDVFKVVFSYHHAEGEQEQLYYDRILACTGFRFDDSIYDYSCKPKLCEKKKFPVQTSSWESTNVPGMYFAGTITQWLDYKKYMSGFIHGFRYNVRTLCKILAAGYKGENYPSTSIPLSVKNIVNSIINRVNSTSALWQQPGFLSDLYIFDRKNEQAIINEELSSMYISDMLEEKIEDCLTVSLEFGVTKFDYPFHVSRIARNNIMQAKDSNFLHPVVRFYSNGQLCSEHHIIEDLAAEWKEPEHIEPLTDYLVNVLSCTPEEVDGLDSEKIALSSN